MRAVVIGVMHLGPVKELTRFAVADKGIILKAVPQLLDHIDMLGRPAGKPRARTGQPRQQGRSDGLARGKISIRGVNAGRQSLRLEEARTADRAGVQ